MNKKITMEKYYDFFNKYGDCNVKVSTPYGFRKIEAIAITAFDSQVMEVRTKEGLKLKTSPDHLIKLANGTFTKTKTLNPGDDIQTVNGLDKVSVIVTLPYRDDLYDLQVEEVKQYYSNGIVSHNSSAILSLMYTMYNTTIKKDKTSRIINDNKDNAYGKVVIESGGEDYVIERSCERAKGEDSKTTLEFYKLLDDGSHFSLNGTSRVETDKNIKRVFGTIDDFLLTALSGQKKAEQFLEQGMTERKKTLAKFLDLESFDVKHKLAKKDSAELKGQLKRNVDRDFEEEKETLEDDIEDILEERAEQEEKLSEVISNQDSVVQKIANIAAELNLKPIKDINIEDVVSQIDRLSYKIKDNVEEIVKLEEELGKMISKNTQAQKMLDGFSDTNYEEQLEYHNKRQRAITDLKKTIAFEERVLKEQEKKTNILDEVPCASKYGTCPFLQDGFEAKSCLPNKEAEIEALIKEKEIEEDANAKFDVGHVERKIEQHNKLIQYCQTAKDKITSMTFEKERKGIDLKRNKNNLQEQKDKEAEYNKSKKAQEDKEENKKKLVISKKLLKEIKISVTSIQDTISSYNKKIGYLEQSIEQICKEEKERSVLEKEYKIYEMFIKATHSSGIASSIVGEKLPFINRIIESILKDLVDFKVYFDKKYNIFIEHEGQKPRMIEMGSGAETSLASFAIRVALSAASNLPLGNLLILDEPATDLDGEHLESYIENLNVLKNYYDVIILISHLDVVKDAVDVTLDIEQKEGFVTIYS